MLERDNNANRKGEFDKQGRTIVGMNEGKLVIASENDTQVFTFEVLGCNAVAIEGIYKDKRFGAITNYDPLNIQNNLLQIAQLGELINNSGELKEVNAELFVRGDWEKVGDKWQLKPKSPTEVEQLGQSIQASFGENTLIKISPYSDNLDYYKKEQGQIIVNISNSLKNIKRISG